MSIDRGTYAFGVLTIAQRAAKGDPAYPGETLRDRGRRIFAAEGASHGLALPDRGPVLELAFASECLDWLVGRLRWHSGVDGSTGEIPVTGAGKAYALGVLTLALAAARPDPAYPGEVLHVRMNRLFEAEGQAYGLVRNDFPRILELARVLVPRRLEAGRLRQAMANLDDLPCAASAPARPVAPPVHTLTRHRGRRA
ncbi:hypothetical protein ACQVP2_07430 [Methylobacterium aquaticum]|uniref:hypothetical protein n=1 Tax=Methylobacterium aquaticum TaxID=270351 RepID=UPI003D179BBF